MKLFYVSCKRTGMDWRDERVFETRSSGFFFFFVDDKQLSRANAVDAAIADGIRTRKAVPTIIITVSNHCRACCGVRVGQYAFQCVRLYPGQRIYWAGPGKQLSAQHFRRRSFFLKSSTNDEMVPRYLRCKSGSFFDKNQYRRIFTWVRDRAVKTSLSIRTPQYSVQSRHTTNRCVQLQYNLSVKCRHLRLGPIVLRLCSDFTASHPFERHV